MSWWSIRARSEQSPSRRNGQLIMLGSGDDIVRAWDAATGAERRVLQGQPILVRVVAFSPDGQLNVSGSDDCRVRVMG
jgi:WD40 repeat protein